MDRPRTHSSRQPSLIGDPRQGLLDLFYPIHYTIGMAIEDALRSGVLTRKQAAILWLIRSEGGDRRAMRRKDIERLVTGWFEVSNSAITKALRGMARPPLELIRITESPISGREKIVAVTPKGEKFLKQMIQRATAFFDPVLNDLGEQDTRGGIGFLDRATRALAAARTARSTRKPSERA